MNRRDMLKASAAAFASSYAFPFGWAQADESRKRRILYFTRCTFTDKTGYEHEMVHRNDDELSFSERVLTELGKTAGLEVVCSKDGRVFDEDLKQFDCIAFNTSSGDMTQPNVRNDPPMTLDGKRRLLDAIHEGMPFVGIHSASCTFRTKELDPFLKMLGGEFVEHGNQQEATMRVASPKFPGLGDCGEQFRLADEWYVIHRCDPQMRVILVQETAGMHGKQYERPPFPSTWAKMHGKGRVFYTAMGHRADIWTNKIFQAILLGGFSWALGDVDADLTPNLKQVAPEASMA